MFTAENTFRRSVSQDSPTTYILVPVFVFTRERKAHKSALYTSLRRSSFLSQSQSLCFYFPQVLYEERCNKFSISINRSSR